MEDKIMKKMTFVLMVLFTASILGGLCSIVTQLDNVGKERTEYVYVKQLPNKMPNVLLDPMTGVPLY